MNFYFLIADQNGKEGPDIKGLHIKAKGIDTHEELLYILDSVRYNSECQDKFYMVGFQDVVYDVASINGIAIGQFNYTETQAYSWTDSVVKALTEQRPDYVITVIEPEALATVIGNSGGLTLDDISGPWKGVIVRA